MSEFGYSVLASLIVAVISYLIGSFNMAILISRFHKFKDIRDYGSGNAGMTNMLRTFGKRAATWTFIGDFAKGALVVMIAESIGRKMEISFAVEYVAALFVVVGHIFPIYFKFHGGKGISAALGAMMMLDWPVFVSLVVGLAPMIGIIRIVSAVALCGASLYPVLTFLTLCVKGGNFLWDIMLPTLIVLILVLLVFYAHKENIVRLRNGTEHRFEVKKK